MFNELDEWRQTRHELLMPIASIGDAIRDIIWKCQRLKEDCERNTEAVDVAFEPIVNYRSSEEQHMYFDMQDDDD